MRCRETAPRRNSELLALPYWLDLEAPTSRRLRAFGRWFQLRGMWLNLKEKMSRVKWHIIQMVHLLSLGCEYDVV